MCTQAQHKLDDLKLNDALHSIADPSICSLSKRRRTSRFALTPQIYQYCLSRRMLDFLTCTAVAMLMLVNANATLTIHSGAKCDVQYLLLYASIDPRCLNQCDLLLASAAQPQLKYAGGLSPDAYVTSTSTLLPSNVLSFQHPADHHRLQVSCQPSSNCRANPERWHITETESALLVTARSCEQQYASGIVQHATSDISCVYEANSTVSVTILDSTAEQHRSTASFNQDADAVLKWPIRVAVLASVLLLQISAARS